MAEAPLEFFAIEFHDSTVSDIRAERGRLTIHLAPAILHRSIGQPGEELGDCWAQNGVLILPDGALRGVAPPLPCQLWDGSATLDGRAFVNVVPLNLPSRVTCIVLKFADGRTVEIQARGFEYKPLGDPEFLDSFPGDY